jgi:hypothetical protein
MSVKNEKNKEQLETPAGNWRFGATAAVTPRDV